jgi:hypothetical protein
MKIHVNFPLLSIYEDGTKPTFNGSPSPPKLPNCDPPLSFGAKNSELRLFNGLALTKDAAATSAERKVKEETRITKGEEADRAD